MTTSSLKARLERLGPVRDIDRVQSGCPEDLVLLPATTIAGIRTIDAALALARRGVSLLRAKRHIEHLTSGEPVYLSLPCVEDRQTLLDALKDAGVAADIRTVPSELDLRQIRDRLGLTQEQFALRFGFELKTLRKWETGQSRPEKSVRAYVQLIARDARSVLAIVEGDLRDRRDHTTAGEVVLSHQT